MEDNYGYEKKTILIVDDEQKIVDLLVHNLKKEGYDTIEANDGQTAIEIALEKRPNLILLDVMLPRVDGLSVCKKIKNTYNVPILMISAKDDELDKTIELVDSMVSKDSPKINIVNGDEKKKVSFIYNFKEIFIKISSNKSYMLKGK